ncbi:biotin-dependent carboxyltransferase family protein [Abyssicoccus albus]|uniref:Biotin-dependent carboxylase-like uncharacterized protein n=1 Tax=Abyssicoccus albus TaxID=1817405 RepID=A0A3N5C574_9BACL|nr:hypothetical protein [Abyssicoccus albus]RPF57438.1 biotin-dependent carboxylase-like uncharacterized protein [Abyssicoccus albus]
MTLTINHPGFLSTIQDRGRKGYRHKHIVQSGASDMLAHNIANALVGNAEDVATIEMSGSPAKITFNDYHIAVLTGAKFVAHTNKRSIMPYKVYLFEPGETIESYSAFKGNHLYLAIAGGFKSSSHFGSKSTYISNSRALYGYKIFEGDELELEREWNDRQQLLYQVLQSKGELSWGIDHYTIAQNYLSDICHIQVSTSQYDIEKINEFLHYKFQMTHQNDRQGIVLQRNDNSMLLEFKEQPLPMQLRKGMLQINRNNEPVILLNDHYPIGRHPIIGVIPSYHLSKISQKRVGSTVEFKIIAEEQMHENLYRHAKWIKSLFLAIENKFRTLN